MSTQNDLMNQRYGRSPRRDRRRRLAVFTLGGSLFAVFLGWATVVNFFSANPFSFTTDSFEIKNPTQSSLRFTVTRDPAVTGHCELRALNQAFTVVGTKWFNVPAGGDRIRTFEATLNTTEQPVSLLVQSCQLK